MSNFVTWSLALAMCLGTSAALAIHYPGTRPEYSAESRLALTAPTATDFTSANSRRKVVADRVLRSDAGPPKKIALRSWLVTNAPTTYGAASRRMRSHSFNESMR